MTNNPQRCVPQMSAMLGDADLVGRFVPVRLQRSVSVLGDDEGHADVVIDLAIPVGVPLVAGASILVSPEDIVVPIAHSFWDHHRNVHVVTTQGVVFHDLASLDEAVAFYVENGWRVVSASQDESRRDLFPLAHPNR